MLISYLLAFNGLYLAFRTHVCNKAAEAMSVVTAHYVQFQIRDAH